MGAGLDTSSPDALAFTGSSLLPALAGAALIAGGAAAVGVSRVVRREAPTAPAPAGETPEG
ncbi:MAG: hypothetical protein ACFCVF_13695 [Kineosporiaceae bacterium]